MGAMVTNTSWLAILILLPLSGAILTFLWPRRCAASGLATALGTASCVAALGWQIAVLDVQHHIVGGWGAPLGIELYADGLSLMMLMISAVVGVCVSVYAYGYFQPKSATDFWPLWLFLWATLNALFLSADLFNLYVTLELLGLAAVALIALAGTANALTSAMRYLLVSLTGSLFYLLGVALLYHSFGSLDIALLAQRLTATPTTWIALGLISIGLLLKTALFPLHFWLPPAHASAPAPVSALLSALVVKASFYIFLRLYLELFPVTRGGMDQLLGGMGAAAVLWGGLQALRQSRLKMLIAYSTVAQIGYLFLAFPLSGFLGWTGALYMLIAHALAKTAMFLAAGNILFSCGHDRIAELDRVTQRQPLTITAFALAGVSIMGLPPSGGFIAKWLLLEAAIRSGQWWWGVFLILGGLLAAAYVFRVVGHAFTPAPGSRVARPVPAIMRWTPLLISLAAILLGLIGPWVMELLALGTPFGNERETR